MHAGQDEALQPDLSRRRDDHKMIPERRLNLTKQSGLDQGDLRSREKQPFQSLCDSSHDFRMHDSVQILKRILVPKDMFRQLGAIDPFQLVTDTVPKSVQDLSKLKRSRLKDFPRNLIGIDVRGSQIAHHVADCAFSRADLSGDSYRFQWTSSPLGSKRLTGMDMRDILKLRLARVKFGGRP